MNSAGSGMSAPASLSDPVFPPLRINPELVRRILVGFIRNEVRKVGFERVVLGLSGGVDSSLVATLAAEALGADNVLALILPYKTSDPKSKSDALQVVQQLASITWRSISVPRSMPTSRVFRTPTRSGAATRWRANG